MKTKNEMKRGALSGVVGAWPSRGWIPEGAVLVAMVTLCAVDLLLGGWPYYHLSIAIGGWTLAVAMVVSMARLARIGMVGARLLVMSSHADSLLRIMTSGVEGADRVAADEMMRVRRRVYSSRPIYGMVRASRLRNTFIRDSGRGFTHSTVALIFCAALFLLAGLWGMVPVTISLVVLRLSAISYTYHYLGVAGRVRLVFDTEVDAILGGRSDRRGYGGEK
jgi:hypothetical protein